MGFLELTVGSVIVGFFTVFGWNYGNTIYEKYVEPIVVEQPSDSDQTIDTEKKVKR
jgi:hypothetical protein